MRYIPAIVVAKSDSPIISRPLKINFQTPDIVTPQTGGAYISSVHPKTNIFTNTQGISTAWGMGQSRYYQLKNSSETPQSLSADSLANRSYLRAGTFSNFYFAMLANPQSVTITLMVNGIDTSITATATKIGIGQGWALASSTQTVQINSGDWAAYKITNNDSIAAALVFPSIMFRIT